MPPARASRPSRRRRRRGRGRVRRRGARGGGAVGPPRVRRRSRLPAVRVPRPGRQARRLQRRPDARDRGGDGAEAAADGTLFLDEIGDLSTASQVKLLRLLQEGEYFPLGSDRPKRLRARVIAATHQDLAARQAAGGFRRDLYYRLATHQVRIPPLRERKGDVPLLLEHFLAEAARERGKKTPTAPRELAALLATYAFPGNVRELRAMVFDAVSLHRDRVLSTESFVRAIERGGGSSQPRAPAAGENPFAGLEELPTIHDGVEFLVEEALARSGGNQTIAARLLGITQSALSKRLKAARASRPPDGEGA